MSRSNVDQLRQSLNEALKAAVKSHDAQTVAAFRSALSAIANAESTPSSHTPPPPAGKVAKARLGVGVADVARRQLSLPEVIEILRAEVDERLTAAADYERLEQHDRAAILRQEAAALRPFLDR